MELAQTILYVLTGGFAIFLAITVTRDNFANRLNRVAGAAINLDPDDEALPGDRKLEPELTQPEHRQPNAEHLARTETTVEARGLRKELPDRDHVVPPRAY